MTLRCLLLLAMIVLCAWARPAAAQSCTLVSGSQHLAFDAIDSEPIPATTTSSTVRVRCTRGFLQLSAMKVCVGMGASQFDPGGITPRNLGNGSARLRYSLTSASANGPAWGTKQGQGGGAVSRTITWEWFDFEQEFTINAHATLQAGQTGLRAGTYSATIPGTIGFSTNTNQACSAMSDSSTFSLNVTVNVRPHCTIVANNLNFGSRASLGANVDATTTLGVTCTPGAAYSVKLSSGGSGDINARRMARVGGGTSTVSYQLYQNSGRTQLWGDTAGTLKGGGTGNGALQPHTVYGRVPVQATPVSGTYRDTVTATVEY